MSERKWRYYCESCDWHKESDTKIKGIVGYLCKKCKEGTILDATDNIEPRFSMYVFQEPKTVEHQGYRNNKRVGHAFLEEKEHLKKAKRRKAAEITAAKSGGKLYKKDPNVKQWWRDGTLPGVAKSDKPIDTSKIANVKKYIETGET